MANNRRRWCGTVGVACVLVITTLVAPARADEIWVAPTAQADLGGLGIGSNVFWPATPIGAVRMAWAVPNNLQTFQSAKLVLIPHTPAGAGTLNVFVCRAQHSDLVGAACTGPFPHAFTGVTYRLLEVDVSAAIGAQVGTAGLNYLAVLAYTTPTTTTDHIVGMRFGYAPVTPTGVATLGANTFSGTQTAPAFAGDGSALTNVNANLLDGLDSTAFAATVHGHDVTQVTNAARLGTNTFTGTQTINTGNLDLDDSTATTGNITKNGARFLHDFGADNTFLGASAGNLTMTFSAIGNTGIGSQALTAITTGAFNTGIGQGALEHNGPGNGNTGVGGIALIDNTSGEDNTGIGFAALARNNSGFGNTGIGNGALGNNATGLGNVAVGRSAGSNVTTGSNNIYLGASVAGVTGGESNTMYLGRVGVHTKTFVAGVRGITTVNANAVPILIDSAGQLGTISSSIRFKEDISDMAETSRRLLQLRPVTFRYKQANGDGSKPMQFGLVAEEVADVFPELAVRGADGHVETVHYETLNVLLLNEVQKQQQELDRQRRDMQQQQQRIELLEQRLKLLTGGAGLPSR